MVHLTFTFINSFTMKALLSQLSIAMLTLSIFSLFSGCEQESFAPLEKSDTEKVLQTSFQELSTAFLSEKQNITSQEETSTNFEKNSSLYGTLIFTQDAMVPQGEFNHLYAPKSFLRDGFRYYAVVTPRYGDPDLYILGTPPARLIRGSFISGTREEDSYVENDDILSNEDYVFWSVYGYESSSYTIKIYRKESPKVDIDLSGFKQWSATI